MRMKALILLHGYASNIQDFENLTAAYRDKYDEIFCENFPGHDRETVNIDEFDADKTLEFAEALCSKAFTRHEKVDIIGYSMGGAIAAYLATKYDFNNIILLAPANKYISKTMFLKRVMFCFKRLFFSRDKNIARISKSLKNDREVMRTMYSETIKRITLKSLLTFTKVIKKCNKAIKNSDKKIPNATIFIGDYDMLVPFRTVKFLKKHIENLKVVRLDYATHFLTHNDNAPLVYNAMAAKLNIKRQANA